MAPKKAPPPHPKSDFIPVGVCFKDQKKQEIVIGKALTEGGFGCIYEASVKDGQKKLIAKFEPGSNGPLFVEQNIYTRILSKSMLDEYCKKNNIKFLGLPYLISNGIYNDNRYIVIPKYDYCLEQIMKENQLSLNEIKQVVHCVLNALEYLHSSGYAHADIKAGNLMLNSKKNFSEVYLIDFGLTMKADKAVDKDNKKRAHNGSPFFTSVDAHRGIGPSYRGDIEIMSHNLLFWLSGTLPWLKFENDPDRIMAAKQKLLANIDKELDSIGLGKTEKAMVAAFYEEAKNLEVTEVPNFDKLRAMLGANHEEKKKNKTAVKAVKKVNDKKSDEEQQDLQAEKSPRKNVEKKVAVKRTKKPEAKTVDIPDLNQLWKAIDEKMEQKKTPKKKKVVRPYKLDDSDSDSEMPPRKKPWTSPNIKFYDDDDEDFIIGSSDDFDPKPVTEYTTATPESGQSSSTAPKEKKKPVTLFDSDDFETESPVKQKSEKKVIKKTPKSVKLGSTEGKASENSEAKATPSKKEKVVEPVEQPARIIPGLKVKAAVPKKIKDLRSETIDSPKKPSMIIPGLKNRRSPSPAKAKKQKVRKELRIDENLPHFDEKKSEIIPGMPKTPIRKTAKNSGSPGRTPALPLVTRSGKLDEDLVPGRSDLTPSKITPPSKAYPTDSSSEPRPAKKPVYRNWEVLEESPEKPLLRRSARTFSTSSDVSSHEEAINPNENANSRLQYIRQKGQLYSAQILEQTQTPRPILSPINGSFADSETRRIPVRHQETHSPNIEIVPVERPTGCIIC